MRRSPDPSKARTFRVIAWLFIGAAIILAISFPPLELVMIVPVYLGYTCFRRAKKFAVGSGETAIAKDTRPPILYLRSFQDEEKESTLLGPLKNVAASNRKNLARGVPTSGIREQDALGHVFRKVGPYVALGRPGEKLPELGSAKLYVPDESWQNTIRDFSARSKLIIFRAGQTEGLQWELKELVDKVDPLKVAMILPVRDEAYAGFLGWANAILRIPLPQDYPAGRLVVFDDQWRPSYIAPGRTLTKTFAPFLAQNRIVVKETYWEQMMEWNGLRW
jgi:hypothetical protein